MNTHADKTQKNKSQSMTNAVAQKQGGGASIFYFVDNRSEAIVQRKLQEMANNRPQAMQLKALHRMNVKSVVQMVGGANEFENQGDLDGHFDKHVTDQNDAGAAYGNGNTYENAAKAIAEGDYTDTKVVGNNTYFWKDSTSQFVVVRDGFVRSMFVPGAGKVYYDNQ